MNPKSPVPVYSFLRNHFDLVWRRCWRRAYEHEGLVYQPYSRIQRTVTDRMLDLAERKSAVVELEQTLSLRDYLDHRSGARDRIRQLAADGRFCMLACGEAILDSNQCSMETLARNLASGMVFGRSVTGQWPRVGARFDSFGSSAQLPQIYRQCGIRWVTGFSYGVPTHKYWRGLDGSVVCVIPDQFPGAHQFLDHCYHEPCPHCRGRRCPSCDSTGINLAANVYPPRSLSLPPGPPPPFMVYWVQSEEMLPDPAFPAELPAILPDGFVPKWGGLEAMSAHFIGEIEAVDTATDIDPRVEFNPVQTGTFVTRMRVKNAAREAERFFYTAEAACTLAAAAGTHDVAAALRRSWLDLPLLFFHDAITGTHNDPAQAELLEVAAACVDSAGRALEDAGLAVEAFDANGLAKVFALAPSGLQTQAVVGPAVAGLRDDDGNVRPAYALVEETLMTSPRLIALRAGSRCRGAKSGERRVDVTLGSAVTCRHANPEWTPLPSRGTCASPTLIVAYDELGLVEVRESASGTLLTGGERGRPNTLVLEVDEGDPWGTRGADRRRTVLDTAENSFFLGARQCGNLTEIVHGGVFEENKRFGREADPSIFGLEWTKTVRFRADADHISFATEIYWKSANRRIRVVFPGSPQGGDDAHYGIPGGYLRRSRYEQSDRFLWSPDGDWPALDFFARTLPGPAPVIYNKGAVGARVEDGAMMISLLRSPAFGHCLERYAQNYPMPYGGIRDGGYHLLEYALGASCGTGDLPRVASAARAWNERALLLAGDVRIPSITTSDIALQVLAVKPRFRGRGTVARILNCSDRTVDGSIESEGFYFLPCTLLEERDSSRRDERDAFRFRPFELRSFRLVRA
jgi:hypothetical protein